MNKLLDQYKTDWQIKKDLNANHFVYFGEVNQRRDELDLIRGYTNSLMHQDYHFAVGSYEGHDARFARRVSGATETYILTLSVQSDVAPFYIKKLETKGTFTGRHLQPLVLDGHTEVFAHSYAILAKPQDFIGLEEIFTPSATRELSTHIWPFNVEYADSMLYIYASGTYEPQMLNRMLRSSIWLARLLRK